MEGKQKKNLFPGKPIASISLNNFNMCIIVDMNNAGVHIERHNLSFTDQLSVHFTFETATGVILNNGADIVRDGKVCRISILI